MHGKLKKKLRLRLLGEKVQWLYYFEAGVLVVSNLILLPDLIQ